MTPIVIRARRAGTNSAWEHRGKPHFLCHRLFAEWQRRLAQPSAATSSSWLSDALRALGLSEPRR